MLVWRVFNGFLDYSYPKEEISHRLNVSGCKTILTDEAEYTSISEHIKIKSLMKSNSDSAPLEDLNIDNDALILFTSGTTGKPKGVIHSFNTLSHQISDLHKAWQIDNNDNFFLSLPLNHIHGLVTGVLNGLTAGSSLTLHSQFDAMTAWKELKDSRLTFFTAVPTIYSRLLNYARANKYADNCLDHLRLMISGSSSLSVPLLDAWKSEIRRSGIAERYGMTETGMIASNEINVSKAGCVGKALPSIEIKVDKVADEEFGRVLVRGTGLFKGYLDQEGKFVAHNSEKFFVTGDQGYFTSDGDLKLVGRDRDILKVSGYKVGCGEIESTILNHPLIQECAVIGLEDPKDFTNQMVAAVLVTNSDENVLGELRSFLSDCLAHYKIPRKWIVTRDPLPRNLIGKPDHKLISLLFK